MDLHSLSALDVSAVSDAESPISRVVLRIGGRGRDSVEYELGGGGGGLGEPLAPLIMQQGPQFMAT